MSGLLKNIMDSIADAAVLEMGVDVLTTTEFRSKPEAVTGRVSIKGFFKNLKDSLTDAAMLEMGAEVAFAPRNLSRTFRESFEELLVEIAYAEAADYDEIHISILREHRENDLIHTDECRHGDNDACFAY